MLLPPLIIAPRYVWAHVIVPGTLADTKIMLRLRPTLAGRPPPRRYCDPPALLCCIAVSHFPPLVTWLKRLRLIIPPRWRLDRVTALTALYSLSDPCGVVKSLRGPEKGGRSRFVRSVLPGISSEIALCSSISCLTSSCGIGPSYGV